MKCSSINDLNRFQIHVCVGVTIVVTHHRVQNGSYATAEENIWSFERTVTVLWRGGGGGGGGQPLRT